MTFHADPKDWRLDFYHAMACYLIMGGGGSGRASASQEECGVCWMFPALADLADGSAATKVSKILDKARKGGANIPNETNSHGLRVAATDEMIFNPLVSIFAVIARGGWDFEGDSVAFRYLTNKLHVVQAGRALSGWNDPRINVTAPTCVGLGQS